MIYINSMRRDCSSSGNGPTGNGPNQRNLALSVGTIKLPFLYLMAAVVSPGKQDTLNIWWIWPLTIKPIVESVILDGNDTTVILSDTLLAFIQLASSIPRESLIEVSL